MRVFIILNALCMILNSRGEIAFEGQFYSEVFKKDRFIRVYLPPSYKADEEKRYPVLYVHDGQNAFTTAGPQAAFGWGPWNLDTTVDRLVREQKMREIIMVAIDCSTQRYAEYRGPTAEATNNTAYAKYSRFLRTELKPKIDHDYRTLTNAANTGVMGSSMGGICSLALTWENPKTFGQAASLSGAFQVEKRFFLKDVLSAYSGHPKSFRVYLDSGSVDFSGGDDGAQDTTAVAEELKRIGWREPKNLLLFLDKPLTAEDLAPFHLPQEKFKEAQRSQHNELYWRLRAWRALTFMFPPE
jgi:predicted alpha/beta superfamily hydrolase